MRTPPVLRPRPLTSIPRRPPSRAAASSFTPCNRTKSSTSAWTSRYPDVVDWLETELKPDFEDPGEFMNVTLTAADSTDALTVLKAITNAYMDEVVYAEQTAKSTRLSEVEKIYTETAAKLNRERQNFKTDAEKVGVQVGGNDHDYLTAPAAIVAGKPPRRQATARSAES